MTAYNKADLYNKYVQEQASVAFREQYIGSDSYQKILEVHPEKLYTPNYFVRIGSGLLTAVATFSLLLLLGLITGAFQAGSFTGLLIFFALLCYGFLELMVHRKNYYNAGIDNVLLIITVVLIAIALNINSFPAQSEITSFVLMTVCLFLCIRFADGLMAMLSYISCFTFIFLVYTHLGNTAKATTPFLLMCFSAVIYFLLKRLVVKDRALLYRHCIQPVIVLALISFYVAGNYFVVRELSNEMFHLHLQPRDEMPMGIIFWIFTIVIPPVYIVAGIRTKDLLLIRTGIVLIAATVLTVRYYYTILPAEIVMIIAGILLIVISYALIRYLAFPRKGFCFQQKDHANEKALIEAEALIIAQVFGKKAQVQSDNKFEFGGGSSGGAGASGTY